MNTRTKILRSLAVVAAVASLAAFGVFSAFTSQTDNPGNTVTAGTVVLADNDSDAALYSISDAKPGSTTEACIQVTYSGSLDSDVKLYTPSTIGDLGPHVNLTIEPGSQTTVSFPDCTDFVADAGGALFDGTLSGFATTHDSWANGLSDNPGATSAWTTSDAVVYRVTATVDAAAPDSAQGDSTGSHILRWEAQSQ
ncbi:MAG: TasA family protein [Thermoleophilaceae bacterium]